MAKKTEAEKKAQRKYDKAHKDDYRLICLRLNKTKDADVIDKLDNCDNKQGYIKDLIRKDI